MIPLIGCVTIQANFVPGSPLVERGGATLFSFKELPKAPALFIPLHYLSTALHYESVDALVLVV